MLNRFRANVPGHSASNTIRGLKNRAGVRHAARFAIAKAQMGDALVVDLNHKVLSVIITAEQVGARQPFVRFGVGARQLYARHGPVRILNKESAGGHVPAQIMFRATVVRRVLPERFGENERPARQVRTKAAGSDDRFGNAPFTFAKHLTGFGRHLILERWLLIGSSVIDENDIAARDTDVFNKAAGRLRRANIRRSYHRDA